MTTMSNSSSFQASHLISGHSHQTVDSTTMVNIEPSRFSTFDPTDITKLVRTKDQGWLRDHGGIEGMLLALETDMENGIRGDQTDIDSRRKAFGSNFQPESNLRKIFCRLLLTAIRDPMIVVLFTCAVLSLCFGIQKRGLRQGWQEGVTKILAILVVVIVPSSGKLWSSSQFIENSKISNYIPESNVVRSGKWQRIPICHVVVGEIVFLKPGDQVPADGLFIDGCPLHTEMTKREGQIDRTKVDAHDNPFLFSGIAVVDGYARMLVTAVDKNIRHKHRWIYLVDPLLDELRKITSIVGKIGKTVALLTFAVFSLRLLAGKIYDDNGKRVSFGGETRIGDVLVVIVGILAAPTMIALTSSPNDLVWARTTCLFYSMRRLMKIKILLGGHPIHHAVGCVTTVCMNKTGTLTMDSMKVTKFWQGLNSIEEIQHNLIAPSVLELLHQGIGLNHTQPPSSSSLSSPTNSTENAIFEWAVKQLGMDVESLKKSCTIFEIKPFNSKDRQSGVLISKNGDNTIHIHRKGAPEVIIPMCSHYYESTGTVKVMNRSSKALFEKILEGMAENGLRCIAFAHKKTSIRDCFTFYPQKLILLGLVGLINSCRSGTRRTVEDCRRAGINVKLITGDDKVTARIMATKCGIIKPDYQPGEVIDGVEFRKFSSKERMAKVENICVLARATPDDKLRMVQSLKQKGHVVAFIGGGIGDVQALREANVGLCFGTQGAEIVKACSAIVMSSKDFPLIIDILRWGRGIYDTVQIYTQFLLSATFVALVIDFVMAVSSSEPPGLNAVVAVSTGKIPFPVFQLLWMKLITGTLAVLALNTEKPAQDVMQRPPRNLKEPLITAQMCKKIGAQASYQIAIFLVIHFKGKSLFEVDDKEKDSLVLSTYILCQAFNILNSRLSKKNIFKEMQKKKLFLTVIGLIVFIQFIMVELLNGFSGTARLGFGQWGLCIASSAAPSMVTWFLRYMPPLGNFKLPMLKPKID
ncbi:calcium-transporting ATPase 12, plasma membrane-type-like [Olea europaea subsp. europaea]|uniref:Calcium-transporting ATPase n=1 Tax=Olea europaea subsp. europaea TaxID=158383 RepID=A0A8S0R7I1_OLEEU|nr:calcium-transporting ATPase 12, plasma membrane-type-like [Olea europaea subsp. europaea]